MRWKKFVAGFDVHGDQQDSKANEAFFKFVKHWRPEIRVCGGDVWDFRPLRGKANEDERRESMSADYIAGVRWLQQFKPTHYLRGNHCERLWELAAAGRGPVSDYALSGVVEITELAKKMRCQMLPYNKRTGVLRLGHLKIVHGYACGVYASRTHALAYGSVLFGHTHSIDEHAIAGLERRVARNCGCLCRLDMDYNARQLGTLKQAHGWAYGVLNEKTGSYHAWQAEEIDGRWILPVETLEL